MFIIILSNRCIIYSFVMYYILYCSNQPPVYLITAILSWSKCMEMQHQFIPSSNLSQHVSAVYWCLTHTQQSNGWWWNFRWVISYSTVLTIFFLFSRVCVERFFSSRVAAATNRKQHCRDVIWPYFVIDHREYCIHHAFKSTTIVLPSSTTSHRDLCSF